eukprot:TRINITY_DN57213_c0_g1_i1.p1 TRINITY_DN57213_c0_g1~~TRINITY_DN57213_c0_g1_i1.p1  ORF type:complete len:499 (-),score=80.95 TRINITY_DN57213_c0_g1_i1:210-1706(-)
MGEQTNKPEVVAPESASGTTLLLDSPPARKGLGPPPPSPPKMPEDGASNKKTAAAWGSSDSDDLKKKVRESRLKIDKYNVMNCYFDTGIAQLIARHHLFESITLGVICANAVWIAVDTDWNTSATLLEAHWVFIAGENTFCLYFSFEWAVRFCAFKSKRDCLRDAWFVFDSVLVFFMVMETWVFTIVAGGANPFGDNTAILRLFRLLRLSRLVRMLKSMPQLMILIKGMVTGMFTVVYVLALLLMFAYVFAIACCQLSADTPTIHAKYFDTVPLAMYSLLVYGTFLDALSDFCDAIRLESVPTFLVVCVYIGLAALTVMNMLVGVLCDVIQSVAEVEKETMLCDQVTSELGEILKTLDQDGNGMLSIAEVQKLLTVDGALKALDNVGVDPLLILDFAEMYFFDEHGEPTEMTFERFMEIVLDLRASNEATLKDIMNLNKHISSKMASQSKVMESRLTGLEQDLKVRNKRIETSLHQILGDLQEVHRASSPISFIGEEA